jgi:hypothetical protein
MHSDQMFSILFFAVIANVQAPPSLTKREACMVQTDWFRGHRTPCDDQPRLKMTDLTGAQPPTQGAPGANNMADTLYCTVFWFFIQSLPVC